MGCDSTGPTQTKGGDAARDAGGHIESPAGVPRSNDCRDGALLAVRLGKDADTTGAVSGQIAGAHYGDNGIPESWRRMLTRHDDFVRLANQLHDAARRLP
jgi:hypothetical protein